MSEIKYIQEKQYLQKLFEDYAKEKPHLADVLDPQDPHTSYLLEGFAFLSARLQEKIDDAFPEITLPLLQRLGSQSIKGLPSTAIVQVDQQEMIPYELVIPKSNLILGDNGATFSLCSSLTIQPYTLVERNITHQPNRSCISLSFIYRGEMKKHGTVPLNLFLSASKNIAESLLLGFCQYFDCIEIIHNESRYEGDNLNFCFEPQIGQEFSIYSQESQALSAPQQLLEGFYLPHIHHFIGIDIPQIVKQLDWEADTAFTVNIYFNQQLSITQDDCNKSFYLNCIPVVDNNDKYTLLIDFQHKKSAYLLPVPSNHFLANIDNIQLSLEPHELARGIYSHFYPVTELTAASRLLPQYQQALFYSLTIENNITGHTLYYLNFFDNKGMPMETPPSLHFSCVYIGFEQRQKSDIGILNRHSESMPDGIKTGNITTLSSCYPPIVNNKHYWQLLSHYSANAFMLMSLDTIKQMLADYILYQDKDKQITRKLERLLSGCIHLETHLYDYILKGKPYRCLALTMTLNREQYENEGEAFVFVTHLYHFFPFCLSENMLLEMSVNFQNDEKTIWYLSPSPLKGYKSLL